MMVYATQNIKGSVFALCKSMDIGLIIKVSLISYIDLQAIKAVLKRVCFRPTESFTFTENPIVWWSMTVLSIKSLIGVKFNKKSPYRELTETTLIDRHTHSDGDKGVREREVEHTLVTEAKKRGGIAPKFVSPGLSGMPDRLVLLPDAKMGFVELKAPGKKPRALQEKRHRDLRNLGYRVYVLDKAEKVKEVLDDIQTP